MSDTTNLFTRRTLGFVRVAAISTELRVADPAFNTRATVAAMAAAAEQGCQMAVLPELGLTGYSCGDLFLQGRLLDAARGALSEIAAATARHSIAAVVGVPLESSGRLYNCAAFAANGRIAGVVIKTYLPTYNEFYEARWFTRSTYGAPPTLQLDGAAVPFGADLLFAAANMPACVVGIELCEDLWAVEPPSGRMALAGATLLINASASDEVLGKAEYRRELIRQQSARCLAAYAYAGAGAGESTTDVVYAGHSLLAENGLQLAETDRFQFSTQMVMADLDLQRMVHERMRSTTFSQAGLATGFRTVAFDLPGVDMVMAAAPWNRPLARTPFVPANRAERARHSSEIFNIQATGLARRLKHTGAQKVVIGISGGLDSTLALLVITTAFDRLGLDRQGIVAITMPGFGTTARTRSNAEQLADLLGVTLSVIPITDTVRLHFRDIGHPESQHDVTYENAQARERTQILMDVANQIGGLVVGTGDLSEGALGWMTFNGDHMSMYHVNAGVPKTLVRYLVEWAADEMFHGPAAAVLRDIAATPITPELLPLGANQELEQKTEETIGPYALHDFFLFYTVRCQFTPAKIFYLARQAFAGDYDDATIVKWLGIFYRRFFSQQFKRSSMPDGPKVGSVALSPRGDWRMPSDAEATAWLAELG